jgi:hypothetical protein
MSATAAQNPTVLTQPRRSGSQRRILLIRFVLAAAAVAFSYLFRWEFLRYLTSEANLRIDLLAGIHLQRISLDTVMWRGALYHYVNACTFVDVWFGAVPLLWSLRRTVRANLAFMAALAIGMFCFNVVRLSISDMLFAAGLSWDVAHNVISGVSYFIVWVWIWARVRREAQRLQTAAA